MTRAWLRIAALLLSLTMIAAACGDDDDGGGEAAPDTGTETTAAGDGDDDRETCDETVAGSQINYGVYAPTASLDPPFVSGALVGGTEIANIYDVLFTYDFEADEYEAKLAESLEPNDDFTEWTLTLREGITYSDGTALDAQLVSDNIDRFTQQGVRNTAGGYMNVIESKEVVDEQTLRITLNQPWAEFAHLFADEPGMIVNLNAIGDDAEAFGAQPPDAAGVGPYVVERNVPGEELVLKARQDYWDGPVCVETLRFVWVPGTQPTWEAFQAGQLDVGFLRQPTVNEQAKEEVEGHFFSQQDGGAAIIFNQREGRPGADPRVRQAFALAIDETTINERAYEGALNVGKSLILEGSRFYSDQIEALPTDTEQAQSLLDEAKADGYDGSIEILCASDQQQATETALASEAMLEAVGFEVEVRTIPTSEQIGEVVQGNFDSACWGFNADSSTAHTTFVRNFHSSSVSNRLGSGSPEMDAALDDALAADGEEELQEAFAEINRIFNEDALGLNYGAIEEGIVWKPGITGIKPTAATVFLFDKAHIES